MVARIYQEPKNAMQSGRSRSGDWVLEYAPSVAKQADPLMGWAGSTDTQQQLRLRFSSLASAQAYAERKGLAVDITTTPPRRLHIQTYADNFR